MTVVWHPLARTDLIELVEYVADDSPEAAYRIHDEIRTQTSLLVSHPEIGRLGRVAGTRELAIAGTLYIAAYRVTRKAITILRLLHGARRWPSDL